LFQLLVEFFDSIWEKLKTVITRELEDLSYMEIITATSEKVDGHIDNEGWDILDSLRRGNPPSNSGNTGEENIGADDMLSLSNVKVLARTRIELDGDVFNLLRGENGTPIKLTAETMAMHELGAGLAVKNWGNFLNIVVNLAQIIGDIVGDPKIRSSSLKGLVDLTK